MPRVPSFLWTPALIRSLATYDRSALVADVVAGLTVGVVALPLAMAFGIASGVSPQAGIYTAVVGGLVVSLLGGSRIQIGGPTGAFVVIVSGIVAAHGVSGLLLTTMMAGAILIGLALTGLGQAVKYLPRPLVIGFTNGIAVLIASTQIKDFLGLPLAEVPSAFAARALALAAAAPRFDPTTVAVATASLAIVVLASRRVSRVPGSVLALVAATAAVLAFDLPVETVGSRFGSIPRTLPQWHLPELRSALVLPLLPAAFTVALLAAVESLLSAVVADSLSGDRHDSRAELLAQGVANLVTPLVGGIPVTGAIARTAANFRSGARSPIAGIVHAVTLLAIVLVLAPLAAYIPLATLAAILFVVAYNMGEWREVASVWRLEWADRLVWLTTFGLTVFADLTVAVEVGGALAALLYIRRVSDTTTVSELGSDTIEDGRVHMLQDKPLPPYVTVLRIHGPFLFGSTDKLDAITGQTPGLAPIVILRLRHMPVIDASGLHAIERLSDRLRATGRTLIICGAREQPARALRQAEMERHVDRENIVPHVQAALRRADEVAARFSGLGDEIAHDLVAGPG